MASYPTARATIARIQKAAYEQTEFKSPRRPSDTKTRFPGFHQRTVHYPAGTSIKPGARPLPWNIILHESVEVPLRDGVKIYADLFFPDSTQDTKPGYPTVLAWSPYGKQQGTTLLSDFPGRAGVPQGSVSELQKWEGPDPAEWCQYGYVICNPDARGAYTSEGDIFVHGHQEAEDGVDVIEWLAKQPWSNGKVGMAGNSWLAIMQWKIGSLRPKGLAAIAPWEGLMDTYREDTFIGGINNTGFTKSVGDELTGRGQLEDVVATAKKYPFITEYWEDKTAHPELIEVPVYAVASWTSVVHTTGTLRGFYSLPESTPKWLRVHNAQEWSDFYQRQHDLRRFFDHYLKGWKDNGWLSTPPVRLSILCHGHKADEIVDRPEASWPLTRTHFVKYHLAQGRSLSRTKPVADSTSTVAYDAPSGKTSFTYTFERDQETTGYFSAHLNISCEGTDDVDVFVQVEKLSSRGYRLGSSTIVPVGPFGSVVPWLHDWNVGLDKIGLLFDWGPHGRLRASHAVDKDHQLTAPGQPYHTHHREVKMAPGETRELQIPITPTAMLWKRGEVLRFTISSAPVIPFPLAAIAPPDFYKKGRTIVRLQGSYLLVPEV